ncbi:MAG: hypothetical protein KGL39_08550 [Patescibacteria group bacterium]|nr:hypothetical protein [Patescibacteria group bacterium]
MTMTAEKQCYILDYGRIVSAIHQTLAHNMQHPITGTIKEVSQTEFLRLFVPEVHQAILANAQKLGVEAVVCFENLQMASSHYGERTVLIMGAGCSYPLDQIQQGIRLGQTPSTFQYPTTLWRIIPTAEALA